jgi:hypothetical protein
MRKIFIFFFISVGLSWREGSLRAGKGSVAVGIRKREGRRCCEVLEGNEKESDYRSGGSVKGRTTENIRKGDRKSGGIASVQGVEVGVFMLGGKEQQSRREGQDRMV